MRTDRIVVAVVAALAGCHMASAVVGTEGGRIERKGLALDIPAGALTDATRITISRSKEDIDPRYEGLSEVFVFEPDGLEFAAPVTVSLDVPEGSSAVAVWSTPDGGFEFSG